MKFDALKSRGARNRVFAAVTLVAVVILLALNLLITKVGQQRTLVVDLTDEGLYTLTDLMKQECSYIEDLEGEVKITFCSEPDVLVSSRATRVAYFMALQMQKCFKNFKVETVNVTYNPTAVSQYKATSMTEILPSDIIVSYGPRDRNPGDSQGTRYRIVNANYFWLSRSTGELVAFNGEYKLATLIKSVTTINRPKAYFTIGHEEAADRAQASALYDLLSDRGLEAVTIDLSTVEKVPDDCVLLIINNPKSDFEVDDTQLGNFSYVSECEKIDRYITENQGAVIVAKDYANTNLPNLEEFLYEWGFEFSDSYLEDEKSHIENAEKTYTDLITLYDTDPNSYGQAIYGDFASLPSAPSVVVGNSGYIKCSYGDAESTNEPGTYSVTRNFAPFLYTSDEARAYGKDAGGEYIDAEGRQYVAGVTSRIEMNTETGEKKYSYVFCANSGEFFSDETLGNYSFANYEVMSAYVENVIRTDEYADAELGHDGKNTVNRGGKVLADYAIYNVETQDDNRTYLAFTKGAQIVLTVFIMIIPVALAVLGIVVRVKRKFL